MSFGVTEAIIVLIIVLLVFGTGKLKSLGSDLGTAIKGFRTAVTDESEEAKPANEQQTLKAEEHTETK